MQIHKIKETYNAEIALIILCCRHFIQTADDNSIKSFLQQNKIDWKKFYQLSATHRIRPIVYKVLGTFKDVIHAENLIDLRNFSMYFNAYALNNKRELYKILNLLKGQNIASKPFKGVDFSEKIYGSIGLREFSDNDIIIKEADIDKVIAIMIGEGYTSKDVDYYKRFPKQFIRDYKDFLFEKYNGFVREFAFEFHFKTTRYFQGYTFSFADIIGEDYLDEKRNLNEKDYLKIIILNNGLMDLYPDIRSILDLAITLKKINYSIKNIDDVLQSYLKYGISLSHNLLNSLDDSTKPILSFNELKFYNFLEKDILSLETGKRKSTSTYFKFNISNTKSFKRKLLLIKKNLQLIIRPGLHDINLYNFKYYFVYYFTKPFRILKKSHKQ